ncbi:hypothetical protein ACJIZ3_021836 [Penstemon smallii]|uniref:Uncharacterized protein n=1 Tax=Penstemon smallii TaxID=265156 RepID=A0ABD3SMT9_9LAMI
MSCSSLTKVIDLFGADSWDITGPCFNISDNWPLKLSSATLSSELFPKDLTLSLSFSTLSGSNKTLFIPEVSSGSNMHTSGSFILVSTLSSCNSTGLVFDTRGNRAAKR